VFQAEVDNLNISSQLQSNATSFFLPTNKQDGDCWAADV
jgi:hypothetical protein